MCAVEAQRCVDCVSAVLHAVLTRAATLRALFDANRRAWRSWTSCALVDDRLTCRRQRPRPWQIADPGTTSPTTTGSSPVKHPPAGPPGRPPPATWGQRRRNDHHRCRHHGQHRSAHQPLSRPGRLPNHPRQPRAWLHWSTASRSVRSRPDSTEIPQHRRNTAFFTRERSSLGLLRTSSPLGRSRCSWTARWMPSPSRWPAAGSTSGLLHSAPP
jgi:hypothetical protein